MSNLAQLLTDAQQGDEQAIAKLIDQFGWIVSSECGRFRSRSNGNESVSDLNQETWLRIWSKLDLFQLNGHEYLKDRFESWLRKVCRNVLLNIERKVNRRESYNDDLKPEELPAEIQTPSSIANQNLEGDQLLNLVNKLPDEQRKIISLHFLDDLNLKQIADELNLTYDQVRHRFHAALRQLERFAEFT